VILVFHSAGSSPILGCPLRRHFPGLVKKHDDSRRVAWSWNDYYHKKDVIAKFGNKYDTVTHRVLCLFWVSLFDTLLFTRKYARMLRRIGFYRRLFYGNATTIRIFENMFLLIFRCLTLFINLNHLNCIFENMFLLIVVQLNYFCASFHIFILL
jgi:hypothetical protein